MIQFGEICPHCGSPKLPPSFIDFDPDALKMPNRERQIMNLLINAKGRFVTVKFVADAIYGDAFDGGPDDAIGSVHAHVSKLRKRLNAIGWTVEAFRHSGYRIKKLIGGGNAP